MNNMLYPATQVNPYQHILNQQTYNSGQSLMAQGIQNGATLYVFRPRNHVPQVHRSFIYNFGDGVVKDHIVEAAVTRLHTASPNKELLTNPVFNTAILPNAEGTLYNVSMLNDLWSFLLIIDITRNSLIPNPTMSSLRSSIDCRYIYIGYFDSEPINPVSHGGVTINPMATLVITHYTHINSGHVYHSQGTQQNIQVLSDIDVVPPQLPINLSVASSPDQKVNILNTPDKVVETSNNSISGSHATNVTISATPSAQLTNKHQSVFIPTQLNSPKHHLMDITNNLSDAMESLVAEEGVYSTSKPSVFTHADDYKDVIQEQMYINLSTLYNQTTIGFSPIDPLRPVTMGQLTQMFPNIQLTDCVVPKDTTWEAKDPISPNLNNVYSTLVSVTVPAMLQNYGIAQVAFRYTSYVPGSTVFEQRDKVELIDIAMAVPCSADLVRHKFNGFLNQLKTSIFPMIRQAGGEFDLIVFSSVGGTNIVSLDFMDSIIYSGSGFYTTYNNLGGVVSPMVGTIPEHYHNATNIYNLVNYIAPDM